MPIEGVLRFWETAPGYAENISASRRLSACAADWRSFPADLHPDLVNALHIRGIHALYAHQQLSYQAAREGKNVVIVKGTASGKSLCYSLPILDNLLKNHSTCAMLLFPTKALAQDQFAKIQALLAAIPNAPPAAIYDGDTPPQRRAGIRSQARILFTNPDMLHFGILPHHTLWTDFFTGLEFLVIDEMHAYRGVFGSHLANVIRRLKRIAVYYHETQPAAMGKIQPTRDAKASPRFLLTTATLSNPKEFAEAMVEEQVELIEQDGSAHGERHFLIYNPPIIDGHLGLRRSAIQEGIRLARDLYTSAAQTVIFARSRRMVEQLLLDLRASLDEMSNAGSINQAAAQVRGYRSGYLALRRREIETGLRSGKVRMVVATNALELGVDIGGMQAALIIGYPGSIASTWQQAGRAGRGEQTSLAVLIASADPLDQYLARHPDYFFSQSPERALVNPDHLLILLAHIRCGAFELPFQVGQPFGRVDSTLLQDYLEILCLDGQLYFSPGKSPNQPGRYFWMADNYPAQTVSLRTASQSLYILQAKSDEGAVQVIGQIEESAAPWMVHPQAVYLHEGESYIVEVLDREKHIVFLRQEKTDYFTEPVQETNILMIEKKAEAEVLGGTKAYGDLQVNVQVKGFRRRHWRTFELLGQETLDMPSIDLVTTGYWFSLSPETVEQIRQAGLWRNDPNDYGPGWSELRRRIRERDGYRCRVCGAPESGRAHNIHHLKPYRLHASMEEANCPENLVTVCAACHRRLEAAVRIRSGLAGLAYAFGSLAPIFILCDPRDLGKYSDPQCPFADGRPTVTFYDQIPDGIGLSQALYEVHALLATAALDLVASCSCEEGCPSCVGPAGENGRGGKPETLAILKLLASNEHAFR